MLTFIVRRLAYSIPVIIIASALVFGFTRATTDPLARLAQSRDAAELLPRERHRLGLDKPLVTQYTRWAKDFVRGDWGQSFISRRDVKSEIRDKLGNTVQLIFWGILFSASIAIAVGVYSAARQYSALDYTFTGLSFLGLSMPVFWFALMAIQFLIYEPTVLFHLKQPIFLSVGLHSANDHSLVDYLRHLTLPVLTLSVQLVAGWSRYQRSSMLDVMSSDYIRTAKAKGVTRRKVLLKHGLRNALIPLTTVMAIDIGALFGGLIITEHIFAWPGMGRLFFDALLSGDTNMVLPWLMVTAVFIIGFNLLADVLYGVLDPRIRLS
ncbi:MAG: peptide/nickel transport system permease protein [Acidimicrobiaceae bacterium]|nr:peptide/nickel transport system permease protein [Acidimicrobiaceae bacterium]